MADLNKSMIWNFQERFEDKLFIKYIDRLEMLDNEMLDGNNKVMENLTVRNRKNSGFRNTKYD